MAPHWTLALVLMISVLLGIGQASITCESGGDYQCVAEQNCISDVGLRAYGCRHNQVCCALSDIAYVASKNSCEASGENVCVAENLCRSELEFRTADECPNNLICCVIENANVLKVQDPLR